MRALASAKFLLSWQYFYRHGDKLSHMRVLKKMLFAQAPLLAIAMEICSFFRIYGMPIDSHHKSWTALMALDLSGASYGAIGPLRFRCRGRERFGCCPPSRHGGKSSLSLAAFVARR